MSAESPIDTSDMVAVHDVFRRALSSAAGVVGAVDIGDDDQVAVVASYFANVLAFLHVHHEGEDVELWPLLLARVEPRAALTVARIAAQHGDVDVVTLAAERALRGWADMPTSEQADALGLALTDLGNQLSPLLAEAEAVILPLASVHMSQNEWGRLAEYGITHFAGDKLWLILGLILEAMSPKQAAAMLEQMAPPAVEFWTSVGRPQYESFVVTVRP